MSFEPMELDICIPAGLEDTTLPNPELLSYYQLAEHRVFWIDYDIADTLLELSKTILLINKTDDTAGVEVEDRIPIQLFIHTYGGSLDACLSFIDICMLSKTPIVTVNAQNCLSAGFWILLAGHRRYCFPRSRALCHSGSGGAFGTLEQTEANLVEYKRQVELLRDFIIERSNIDRKTLNKYKEKEWYLTADEQVQYGIVDSIIQSLDEIV